MPSRKSKKWKPRRSRTTTNARGRETEERLLDAVIRVVSTRGAAAVSHRAVAEEADVALSSTTYYFRDKAEMLRRAFARQKERTRTRTRALEEQEIAAGRKDLSPRDVGKLFGRYLRERLRQDAELDMASLELKLECARNEGSRASLGSVEADPIAFTAGLLRRAGSKRAREDAEIVIYAVNGMATESLARGSPESFSRRAGALASRLLERLLAEKR